MHLASGPLVGTLEQVIQTLTAAEGMGLTYAIGYFIGAAYDRSSIELSETKVFPSLA
jgi:hypothetical protein